ncbi:hypothetical protein [Chelatococcus reniformis]|uniref:Uncharacterized protein n=1 Tax=Chelatococcus reniformis TaxID=1494448 RepID=A0A916U035_9HYPH|nr:hypothetical protein [Chelatococcus reniformis]GGC53851.1 hypothetical protein GCM10010994_11040 [Chelatococcus reniformis]
MRTQMLIWTGGLVALLSLVGVPTGSTAAEFQGAWLEQGGTCQDVFVSTGKGLAFKPSASAFTAAFIIAGNRLQTPLASCAIKATKRSGDRRVLDLACTNAVASEEMKAILASRSAAELRRYTSLTDTVGSSYRKCGAADVRR